MIYLSSFFFFFFLKFYIFTFLCRLTLIHSQLFVSIFADYRILLISYVTNSNRLKRKKIILVIVKKWPEMVVLTYHLHNLHVYLFAAHILILVLNILTISWQWMGTKACKTPKKYIQLWMSISIISFQQKSSNTYKYSTLMSITLVISQFFPPMIFLVDIIELHWQ